MRWGSHVGAQCRCGGRSPVRGGACCENGVPGVLRVLVATHAPECCWGWCQDIATVIFSHPVIAQVGYTEVPHPHWPHAQPQLSAAREPLRAIGVALFLQAAAIAAYGAENITTKKAPYHLSCVSETLVCVGA